MKPKTEYDALVNFTLLETESGGREAPVANGYRGSHLIDDDYLTSGQMDFIDDELVFPGSSIKAFVTYISPKQYPKTLWVGKIMNIQEGSKVVGKAEVLAVYNELLKRNPS